jgi:REP element-mobilizing transposase RayT
VRARRSSPHSRRPVHAERHPVHVTMRARADVPSLRSAAIFRNLRRALAAGSKEWFRVVHFSVQSNHVHLIVEAVSTVALSRGMQGLAVRCARAANRAMKRRGSVWDERFHGRALRSPREVRRELVYVLLNFRKHGHNAAGVDFRSSGPWFTGWALPWQAPDEPSPTAAPRSWLARVGWFRGGGAIDWGETPGAALV